MNPEFASLRISLQERFDFMYPFAIMKILVPKGGDQIPFLVIYADEDMVLVM